MYSSVSMRTGTSVTIHFMDALSAISTWGTYTVINAWNDKGWDTCTIISVWDDKG